MSKLERIACLFICVIITGFTFGQKVDNERVFYEHVYQGQQANKKGDIKKAIKEYNKAFMANPTNENVNYILGCLYALDNKKTKAFEHLELYIKNAKYEVFDFSMDPDLYILTRSFSKWNDLLDQANKRRKTYNNSFVLNRDFKDSLSKEEYIEDLKVLKDVLEISHPGYDWYTKKEDFDSVFQNAISNAKSSSVIEEYKDIVPIIEMLHCGHTAVQFNDKEMQNLYTSETFFPYPIKVFDNELYLIENKKSNERLKIISINNINSNEIIEKLHHDVYGDGFSTSLGRYDFEEFFDFYMEVYFDDVDTFELAIYNVDKDTAFFKEVVAVSGRKVKSNYNSLLKYSDRVIEYEINEEENYAILTINSFSPNPFSIWSENFDEYLEGIFKEFKSKKIENLVVDLRNNSGGYFQNVRKLLSYFVSPGESMYEQINISDIDKVPHKEFTNIYTDYIEFSFKSHFTKENNTYQFRDEVISNLTLNQYAYSGDVYIMTSGVSFSGSSIYTRLMEEYYPHTTIVGEETGGGKNGTTAYYAFDLYLPNSQLKVTIPMVQFVFNAPQDVNGGGIIPDIYCYKQITDYINDTDSPMECTIEIIKMDDMQIAKSKK